MKSGKIIYSIIFTISERNMEFFDDPSHTFIIAEAGSNWKCGTFEEDFQRAKELITVAAKAGTDAVKFQTYKAETVYVPDAGSSNYLSEHGINENINKIFETNEDYIVFNESTSGGKINLDKYHKTTLTDQYSSDNVELLSKAELKTILTKENLLPKS